MSYSPHAPPQRREGEGRHRTQRLSETAPRPPQPPSQLHILRHERNALGVDGAQVRVLEEVHEERLRCLLQREDRRRLPPQLARSTGREVEGDFADLRYQLSARIPEAWEGGRERKNGVSRRIGLTTRLKGSLAMSKSVLFWYFLISCSATVPGRKRRFFCRAAAPEPSPLPVCQLCRGSHVTAEMSLSFAAVLDLRSRARKTTLTSHVLAEPLTT